MADGPDFVVVYASICDARGNLVTVTHDRVTFSVTGEGEFMGDASIAANPMRAQGGIATALIRSTCQQGSITVTAEAFGLESGTVTFRSLPLATPVVPGEK